MDLFLAHCDTDGTLLDGTSHGDGIAEMIKPLGWRWSRQLEQWYLPHSRDHAPATIASARLSPPSSQPVTRSASTSTPTTTPRPPASGWPSVPPSAPST